MKKLLLLCVLLMTLTVGQAQKVYFIYMQSDAGTPFFVKMGDQVTSSNPSGYLILSKLVDSTYQFTVGKTGQTGTDARFSVTIDKKDHGYLLRETNGAFNLFDLQTLTLLQPVSAAGTSSSQIISKRTDPFSVLLAQAANDPSLLEVRTAVATAQDDTKKPQATTAVAIMTKAPEKTMPDPEAVNTDTATFSNTHTAAATAPQEAAATDLETAQQAISVNEPEPKASKPEETATPETTNNTDATEAVADAKPYKPSVVTRRSESSTSEGFGLVFLDAGDEGTDTIRILIPNQSFALSKSEPEHEDLKKFLNISNTDTAKTSTSVDAANAKLHQAETKKKAACVAASDRDFFKLRKNMAAKENDDAMIEEARKAFRKNCYSTEQVKNLSSLFLTPASKYQFFDAAYGHVSNREDYAALQSELQDAYYVNRFKALIANQ